MNRLMKICQPNLITAAKTDFAFQAIKEIHFPPENASLISNMQWLEVKAQLRLIFEEFFWVSFALAI